MTNRRESLAWVAGFFDGEGHSYVKGAWSHPNLNITQVHPETLHHVRAITGVGIINGPRYPKKGQPFYVYDVHGYERVQHFFAQIWPWLGTEKREQAAKVLRAAAKNGSTRRSFTAEGAKATATHCARGHDKATEGWQRDDRWFCRACIRENKRRRYAEKKRLAGEPYKEAPNRRGRRT